MLTIQNEQLQHIAEFREEATNVVSFLPAIRITPTSWPAATS
jgi:hypothetical protein